MIEMMGILILVDVVDYTTQSVNHGTQKTKDFTDHFEKNLRSMAASYNAHFIRIIGDAVLLFFEAKTGCNKQFIEFASRLHTASCTGELDRFNFQCNLRMISHFGTFHFEGSGSDIKDFIGPEGIQVFRMEKSAGAHDVFVSDPLMSLLGDSLKERNIDSKKVFDGILKGFNTKMRIYKLLFPDEKKPVGKDIFKTRLDALEKDCGMIPVFGDYYRMRMEDNFINLDITPDKEIFFTGQWGGEEVISGKSPAPGMDSISIKERLKDINDTTDIQSPGKSHEHEFTVEKLYVRYRQAMIFGLPGSGKTTTLSYFAFKEFQHNKKLEDPGDQRLVMFISCRSIASYQEWYSTHAGFYLKKTQLRFHTVESYLFYFLHEFLFHLSPPKLKKKVQAAGRQVVRAFFNGKLTLLVDAMDEAHSNDTKESVLNALKELSRECQTGKRIENRLYLTARFSERERSLSKQWEAPQLRVRSLDREQLRQMAEYFYKNDKVLYNDFSEAVWKEEIAAKVGGTPLTALLVLVYFENSRTLDSRFQMYHILMTFILARAWKHIKEGTFNRDMKTFIKEVKEENIFAQDPFQEARGVYDALSLLAFAYTQEQSKDIKEQEILAFFRKFAINEVGNEAAGEEAKKWMSRLKEDHVLIPTGPVNYMFIHHSVMEFLASRFITVKLKNPQIHEDKFPFGSIEELLAKGNENFLQSETLPIAVGSGIDTGANLLRLLKQRIAIEREEKVKGILYLTALKCLAEWESYFDRQYRQLRLEILQVDLKDNENKNKDAVEWIYTYIKEILESKNKQALGTFLGHYRDIPHLTRSILIEQFLSTADFFAGDSELVALRKELLERLVTKPAAKKWFKQYEQAKWTDEVDNLSAFDSVSYHPDDKNFNYYRHYTGSTLYGLLGSPNFKHSHCVTCVAISSDGKTILSGSDDKTIKWWDLETGKEIKTFQGHADYVKSVVFSPNGKTMVSGSDDRTVKWWDLETSQVKRTLAGHEDHVNCINFSSDGNTVISGSADNTIKWWDLESGREIKTLLGHERAVNSVSISVDGKNAISGSDDKTVKWWDLETGQCIRTFTGHTDHVKSVAFGPGGKTIISASWDNTIKCWNLETGEKIRTIKGHDQPINSIAVSADGCFLVSASWDKTIKYWRLRSGNKVKTFVGHSDHVRGAALSPDGRTMVSGSRDNTLRCWDLESGKEIKTFRGHGTFVNTTAFSSDGQTVISGSRDFTLKWWDLASGKEKQTLIEHRDHINSICFSPDGKTVISGSFDNTLKWWDLESGKVIKTFKGHENGIASVSFRSKSKTVVSGSFDNTLKLWDLETGKAIRTLKGHQGFVWSIAVSPDDNTLISGSDDKTLKQWDLETGEAIKTLTGHEGHVYSVNFSPDGKTAVSGSSDQTLKLWNLQTGGIIWTFRGHEGIVWSVVFSPDGQYIVSCSWDYTIKIWELETGKCIRTITLLWRPKEIKPSPMRKGFYACANGNGTTALFDFSELMK